MAVIYIVYTDNKLPHMITEGITLMACARRAGSLSKTVHVVACEQAGSFRDGPLEITGGGGIFGAGIFFKSYSSQEFVSPLHEQFLRNKRLQEFF